MNTETATMTAEPALHRELLDRLAERFPIEGAVEAGWCDILNSFKVGTVYAGSGGIGKLSASVKMTMNPNGTVKILELKAIGKDYTAEVLKNGGGSIPVIYSPHAYDCQTSSYYHGWKLYGPTIDWMAKLVSEHTGGILKLSEPTLFSRYWSPNDTKKWFAFDYGGLAWHWTELTY